MYASVNPNRARGEHAIWGDTASDVFSDERVASLARAACLGDAEAVARLVHEGADPNAIGEEVIAQRGVRQVMTPLLWAIDCGNIDGIGALLDAGADPNHTERWGATPVTEAARLRDPEILRLLLRRGGNPNSHNRGDSALQIAMQAEPGLELVDGMPPERAWANWDALIAAGADPDFVAPDGRPLVIEAAYFNQWHKVERLLDRGWDGDWIELGSILQMQIRADTVGEGERLEALHRVRAIVISHSVRFPIEGLMNMERDERGHYVQPSQN